MLLLLCFPSMGKLAYFTIVYSFVLLSTSFKTYLRSMVHLKDATTTKYCAFYSFCEAFPRKKRHKCRKWIFCKYRACGRRMFKLKGYFTQSNLPLNNKKKREPFSHSLSLSETSNKSRKKVTDFFFFLVA